MKKPIEKIYEIKLMLKIGQISFDEAKSLTLLFIKEMETKAEKVARKFNKKPPKFSFTSLMR